MNKLYFSSAFLIGAVAILWTGYSFIGLNSLALAITVAIAGVYTLGFIELHHFRKATSTLCKALDSLAEPVAVLDEWIKQLHPSLQNAVRLRIQGERPGLPAPVITPYLVGLLVMLGLLGTFVGMVDTLRGAVVALEGTTELAAIRAGLVAPINGLGLAFGTSIAGVTGSALLGLVSILSRRERLLANRQLDGQISSKFQAFSLNHSRLQTYSALQSQAQLLPEVAASLHSLSKQLERMGSELSTNLTSQQDQFHNHAKASYTELASSVDRSLKESLSQSSQLVGEAIKPIVAAAMEEFNSQARTTHEHLSSNTQQQLEAANNLVAHTHVEVNQAWRDGLNAHQLSNKALIDGMSEKLEGFSQQLAASSDTMLSKQNKADEEKLALWQATLQESQTSNASDFKDSVQNFSERLQSIADLQHKTIAQLNEDFKASSLTAATHWQQSSEQSAVHQSRILQAFEQTASNISSNAAVNGDAILNEMRRLLASSQELIQVRITTEASWIEGHSQRMENLSSVLKTELSGLRGEEQIRANAALEQFTVLQTSLADNLAKLGKELEEPMSRLIETASEAPRAAADVISQLQAEITSNTERDNELLVERLRIMETLNVVSDALHEASLNQGTTIEHLVQSSASALENISNEFGQHIENETTRLATISNSFSGSAIEISTLAEAFAQAVTLFNESNSFLVENLNRIEDSLEKSSARSDEQLGYYVAQAREIIDHSLISQKELFDELRQISQNAVSEKEEALSAEVN